MLLRLTAWAPLVAAYFVLVGQLSADEVGLALACGLGAAIWLGRITRVAELHFRLERAAAGATLRAIATLPRAVLKVAAALLRGSNGRVVRQRFVHGNNRDPADAARRAVSLLAVSLAPDKFALRLPGRRDELELHSLVESDPAGDARWPA